MNNKERNNTLDLLRGIAILIVVIGHAIQANLLENETCVIWSKVILSFQMPLLFFLSGYTLGYSFPNENTKVLFGKKTIRLLLPYLTWTLIHYVIMIILPVDYRRWSVLGFLKEFFLSDFWFLRVLYLFFVIFFACNWFAQIIHFNNKKILVSITIIASILVMILMKKIPLLDKSTSLWWYLWFLCGYFSFGMKNWNLIKKLWSRNIFRNALAFSTLILMITVWVVLIEIDVPSKVIAIVYVVCICIFVCAIERVIPARIRKTITGIGSNTLPIYAIHWCLLFSPLWRVGMYHKLFGNLPLVVSSILTAVVWVVLCNLLTYLVRKYKLTRVLLLGEK